MMKTPSFVLAAALLAGSAGALASEGAKTVAADAPQASIHFLNLRQSIREWQADGQDGIWIQDGNRKWYYAKLQTPCHGLEFAVQVGFESRTNNTLDRFGYVVVPREGRCQITSLTESDAPPDEKKTRKVEAEEPVKGS